MMRSRVFHYLVLAALILAPSLPRAGTTPVMAGFDDVHMPDGTEVGIWYPARGKPISQVLGLWSQTVILGAPPVGAKLALVVMSHGTGGSFAEHLDTAEALAEHGFVVAALTHPGDNWQDQSEAAQIQKRPAALESLINFMLGQWRFHGMIDPSRIGAFGFSSGGFTVLALAGGKPDLLLMAGHCAAHPAFFDCSLVKPGIPAEGAWPVFRDSRIKALVVAAPALGFTFSRSGLQSVTVPVQLWRAGNDQTLPAPYYADAVRAALPAPAEFHNVPGAGHLDFLAPCASQFAQVPACTPTPGFDRVRFHQYFNAEIVRFFTQKLP